MALERTAGSAGFPAPIQALPPVLPLPPTPGAAQAPARPQPDQILQLELSQSPEGDWLMSAAEPGGARYRVPEDQLARLPPQLQQALQPGQLLLVRVLATEPQLQLAVLEQLGAHAPAAAPAPSPAGATPGAPEPPALQLDQAAMHRFIRPLPDAPTLAARWQTLALQALHAQQQAATLTAAQAGTEPGAGDPGAATRAPWAMAGRLADAGEAAELAQLPRPPQVLLLWQALSPEGQALDFWLLRPPPGEGGRSAGTALSLQLRLLLRRADGTAVLAEIVLSPPGVVLTLSTERAALVPALRGRLSLLAARLGCAGLRLMRCHVLHAPLTPPAAAAPDAHLALARMALPPALFRAAAEILVVFSPPFR